MFFQKNISANTTPYQYRTKEYIQPNSRIIYQGPKIYKEEIFYEYEPDSLIRNSSLESEKKLEINNEEIPSSKIYAIRKEINSLNRKVPQPQLMKDKTYNSSMHNFHRKIREEITPSPKTINIGDTKESIESNQRNLNIRRSPDITRRFFPKKNNNMINYNNNYYYEPNEVVEYRQGSYDRNRNYYNKRINNYYEPNKEYIIRRSREDSPMNYLERSGNKILDRVTDGFNASGIMPPYDEQMSPYHDELNYSNDYEGNSSDYKKTINQNENISYDNGYRQNRFDKMNQYANQGNNMPRIRITDEYNNYNNMNNTNYQSQTMNLRSRKVQNNNIMNNTAMSFAPKHSHNKYIPNKNSNLTYQRDDIKEKYQNQTYNNMTYKDVKKIVNKFTKVYDPKKNDKGILIEDSQIILPGAEDDVFNNRYRVLTKMRRLSNILLAKQNSNRQSSSKKHDEEFFYAINTNNLNNRTNINNYDYYNEEENNENNSDYDYNIRSFNKQQYDKKAKTPIKYIDRKTKNKNGRFKYVSLAMLASKGVNTENRIILRKMRLEKGGVVDLAQMEKRRGKYKIRKVSRSPGYNRTYYRKNLKNREKAAKCIQDWWRKLKSFMSMKIKKIILIQSIYRGRFVRKYLYDLLYLNYLYLSFCQKIEHVLKKVIKPYIFYMLKNQGKTLTITSQEEIKDFDILKNIIASKEKKWRILNMRKGMDKLRQYLRKQEKITLALYKLLKIKAEKNSDKNAILKNALRKWNYLTKIEKMKLNKDISDKDKINIEIKNQNNKIKGLFNILNGINAYSKKSALEPTLPKIINYLKQQKLNLLLRKLINKKTLSDKEKLRDYFYKYIKIILKSINEEEKEENEKLRSKPKPVIKRPKNIISKTEYINLPKVYTKVKEKPLKIDKTINRMEIKGQPKKKEQKKEIKKMKYEIENYDKILLKGEEKRKDDINKMKARLFLYLINSAKKKQNKNILRKYFNKYFRKIIKLQREEDRKNYEEKEKEENAEKEKEKAENNLRALKKIKLQQLPKIKNNFNKNILRKYFDLWKKRTFNTKESSLKLFIKILDIMIDNYYKKLIRQKLRLWKKKPTIKKAEKSTEVDLEPEIKEKELDIFTTLKNLKDIINFNDYLRNLCVNKYGKEFLDKLDKTRNPRLMSKALKKMIRKKSLMDKNNLRKGLNNWKNKIDLEKRLNKLKTKLLYKIYDKNKNNNQSNLLLKYFNRWRNINNIENIKEEIYNLKNSENAIKNLLLKTILRNRDYNNRIYLLKTYLNKWKSILKKEIPKINNLSQKIRKLNTNKNAPEFLDKLNTIKNINKRNDLLLKGINKRNKAEKIILLKYLLLWRNKINGLNSNDKLNKYRDNIISILLNKNDKNNIAKAFNKWRYNKTEKLPVNAYLLGIKKIKNIFTKKPFDDFVNKMDKTNPTKLKSKGKNMQKILDKISKENPYNKLINNMKILIRKNKLKNLLPKVHEKIKGYYLPKYFNIWRNNAKEQRIKNINIITKWLKKKYDIEKEKKLKRRNELLKRIINNKIKLDKYQLKLPLRFWKKIASILSTNINAKIIQRFCRRIMLKKQRNKRYNQNKLKNILLNLYKKNLINTIAEPEQYDELNKLLLNKEKTKEKLRNKLNNIDKNNNKVLLRLALKKWNEGKPLFEHNLLLLQNKVRQLLSKNKLNNMKLLQNILKHIIESNETKDKKYFRDKFIQWYLIAKKLNYHDTSKIEEFIRKIAIGRLIKKLQCTLDKYSNKYFIYLLNNIAKLNLLKNTLKKKPNQIALDEIKEYIRKKDINDLLDNIVNNKNDKENSLLMKKYLDKWREKVDEINDKENEGALMIQKILRGKKIKQEINRELNIKKILTQIINRYDDDSKLKVYFMRWSRINKKLSLHDNARIIQNFCRTIHDKYLKLKKEKNFPLYQNLAKKLINLGQKPKEDFLDELYNIYKIKNLEKVLNDLNDKRKDILGEALDNIKYRNKMILLKNIVENLDNKNKYLIKRILNRWKNKAFNNKYVLLFLTTFVQNKEEKDNNILRSALCTWLYKAMLFKIKHKEKIISEFVKDIQRKKYIISKWRHLLDLLKDQIKKDDINDIIDDLKTYKNLDNLFNIINHHLKKDGINTLKKNNYLLLFKEKLGNICEDLEDKNDEKNLRKYLNIWKNKAKKITLRLSKLEELMDLLDTKITKDDVNTMYQTMLLKNILNSIPRIYKTNALKKIKDFVNDKEKSNNLAKNLVLLEQEIKPKIVSPLLKHLYKVYAYKVLDDLFNTINKSLKRDLEFDKNNFLGRMISLFSDRNKDYTYSNKIEKEKKPYTKKILFKSKRNKKSDSILSESNAQLALISPFIELVSDIILKRKKDAFDNINNNHKAEALSQILLKIVKKQIEPDKEEFIDNLKIIKDKSENDGPKQAELFKLLRKYIINHMFLYKKEIYRMRLIFYLIHLTQFNIEMAKSRWIRQLIRKWRFISFVRKMTREKMELMYKNLQVSYLEMVNSIFSDEEAKNPGVAKEFERFGNGIGMFVNEDPYNNNALENQLCLGVKKQYLFPNAYLGIEKVGEVEKKIEGKEVIYGDEILNKEEKDNIKIKEDDKLEKEENEAEEDEEEKEEDNN